MSTVSYSNLQWWFNMNYMSIEDSSNNKTDEEVSWLVDSISYLNQNIKLQ